MKKSILLTATFIILGSIAFFTACSQTQNPNEITFAGSGGYPPFNFLQQDGSVAGFDVDVAQEIANRMNKKLKYVTTSWDGIIEGLRAKRYDGILGSMAVTQEREKIVDFSDPYYFSGPQLIVRKGSGIAGINDFGQARFVGLVTGTTFEQDAKNAGLKAKFYEDDNQTLMELINGRIDGVLTDRIVALNAMAKMKGGEQLTIAGSVLRKESMGIAFRKHSPLTTKVNQILTEMREDGTLTKISEKWFPGQDITIE